VFSRCPLPRRGVKARLIAAENDTVQLESTIKQIPGVLGCVVLANPDGTPAEIQAFTRAGVDRGAVERSIVAEARALDAAEGLGQVFVFELDAESHFGDEDSLDRAAELAEQEARSQGPLGVMHALGTLHALVETAPGEEPEEAAAGRPPLRRVVLSASTWTTEAQVTLGPEGREVVGSASGAKSTHGLNVVAEATLMAAGQLVAGSDFVLRGAALVPTLEREAVLVLVEEQGGDEMLGAALLRNAPATEAAVRATLDAINRRIALSGR
jgi:hypothetical protein